MPVGRSRTGRNHPFHGRASRQETVAAWMGITRTRPDRIGNGPPIEDLGRLRQWVSVLDVPGDPATR